MREPFAASDRRYLAVLCAIVSSLYLPSLIATLRGGLPFDNDVPAYSWPWHEWIRAEFSYGHFPLWCPNVLCGEPTLGTAGTMLTYPPTLLLTPLPSAWGILALAWLHHLFFVAGAYVLGRTWGLSRLSSALGAGLMVMSASVAGHLFAGHDVWHAARAYIPWELTCTLIYLRSGKTRPLFALIFLFWWQFLSGYPPVVLLGAAGCLYLTLVRASLRKSADERPALPANWPIALPLVILVTAWLCAVALLPFKEVLGGAVHSGIPFSYDTAISANSGAFVRLAINDFYGGNQDKQWSTAIGPHEEAASIGLAGLLLALAAPWMGRKLQGLPRGVAALWWPLLPTAILALGYHTPVYHALWSVVPGFKAMRVPARWLEVWALAQPMLAAYGFECWLQHGRPSAGWIKMSGALTGVLGVCALAVALWPAAGPLWTQTALWNVPQALLSATPGLATHLSSYYQSQAWQALGLAGALLAGITLSLRCWINGSNAILPSRLTAGLILAFAYCSFLHSVHFPSPKTFRETGTWPEPQPYFLADHRYLAIVPFDHLNDALVSGTDTLNGYDPLSSSRFWTFVSGNEEAVSDWQTAYQPSWITPFLRVAGVDRVVTYGDPGAPPAGLDVSFHPLGCRGPWSVWEPVYPGDGRAWPRAFLTTNLVAAPMGAQLAELQKLALSSSTSPAAVVDTNFVREGPFGPEPEGEIPDSLQTDQVSPEQTGFRVSAGDPEILVRGESLTPGWTAYVDGEPVPLQGANILFQGVCVPPGRHRVDLVYNPETFRFGLFLTLAAMAGLTAVITASLSGRARATGPRPRPRPITTRN